MTSWWDHPVLAACRGKYNGRIGAAPNHESFRLGVLRTHLASVLILAKLAVVHGGRYSTFIRWDDTDQTRTSGHTVEGLRRELSDIAEIQWSSTVDQIVATEWRQSERAERYRCALRQLGALGVLCDDGTPRLDLAAADNLLAERGVVASRLAVGCIVNQLAHPPTEPDTCVRLARQDGSALWHLVTVVDDVDADVNVVVRAADKINAVPIQERLRLLLNPNSPQAAYIFLPRLMEADRTTSRVSYLLREGLRPSSLRAFMAELLCGQYANQSSAQLHFGALVDQVTPTLPTLTDTAFDYAHLQAIDRKVSARLDPTDARVELREYLGGTPQQDFLEATVNLWPRQLKEQGKLYQGLTGVSPAPDPPPPDLEPILRWMIVGTRHGPPVADLLGLLGKTAVMERLERSLIWLNSQGDP